MAFREVAVFEIREVLRLWSLRGVAVGGATGEHSSESDHLFRLKATVCSG
jgi:hypothetical protein